MNIRLCFIILCTTSMAQAAMPAQPQEKLITIPSASVLAAQLKPQFPEMVTVMKLDTLLGDRTMVSTHVLCEVEKQFFNIKHSACVLETWQKNRAAIMKILLSNDTQEFYILNKTSLWE